MLSSAQQRWAFQGTLSLTRNYLHCRRNERDFSNRTQTTTVTASQRLSAVWFGEIKDKWFKTSLIVGVVLKEINTR